MIEQEIGDDQGSKTVPFEQDPLLGSDAFIDPVCKDAEGEHDEKKNGDFTPKTPIDARPISSYPPQETSAKRRSLEETATRPTWLPENWKVDLKVRNSGATKGHVDRYYVEPTGQRRFHSKNEVIYFLETGDKLKRKPTSEADGANMVSPDSQARKKTGSKSRKSSVSGAKKDPFQEI